MVNNQGVFVAVLPACPCQKVRVVVWVRAGLLQPLATTQQPAQVVLSEQSDKSDITELTIRQIRVCQSHTCLILHTGNICILVIYCILHGGMSCILQTPKILSKILQNH